VSRITVDEARELWLNASDDELKELAQAARARWHEPDHATYMVMRIINYTNVCVAQCDYCAFYVLPNAAGGRKTANAPGGYSTKTSRYGSAPWRSFSA